MVFRKLLCYSMDSKRGKGKFFREVFKKFWKNEIGFWNFFKMIIFFFPFSLFNLLSKYCLLLHGFPKGKKGNFFGKFLKNFEKMKSIFWNFFKTTSFFFPFSLFNLLSKYCLLLYKSSFSKNSLIINILCYSTKVPFQKIR